MIRLGRAQKLAGLRPGTDRLRAGAARSGFPRAQSAFRDLVFAVR